MKVWLFLAVGTDVQRGSHDGYADIHGIKYVWDSRVPNARAVYPGDLAIVWDKKTWLGAAFIRSVHFRKDLKDVRACPACKRSDIKERKTKSPRYLCNDCKEQFEVAEESSVEVGVYEAHFDGTWHDLNGWPDAQEIRDISIRPKSQLSLRDCAWPKVAALLQKTGNQDFLAFVRANSLD